MNSRLCTFVPLQIARLPWRLVLAKPTARSTLTEARTVMTMSGDYQQWSKEDLIRHIQSLESELTKKRQSPCDEPKDDSPQKKQVLSPAKNSTPPNTSESPSQIAQRAQCLEPADPAPTVKAKTKKPREIDPSKYSTRFIALKLAYQGKKYGGFEYQPSQSITTIEEELWQALVTARLIFPTDPNVIDFSCCEYAKCGRTDKGVSAFGQVISLRVRSNRPVEREPEEPNQEEEEADGQATTQKRPFDPIQDEIRYCNVLNRLLPPEIRVLAWCPSPPTGFSARFSCRERQYRYFFTLPAYAPLPNPIAPPATGSDASCNGWMDIDRMREAASYFVGSHDFRNFCKIDAAKQITNFERSIYAANIVEVEDASTALPFLGDAGFRSAVAAEGSQHPKVYYFEVRGSAFLWHQIRCMVAVLFLVAQRLESPEIIKDLLDITKNPGRPAYQMADEVPLVLWDCVFPAVGDGEGTREKAVEWVYENQETLRESYTPNGNMEVLWTRWRDTKMDEILANQLLRVVSRVGRPTDQPENGDSPLSKRLIRTSGKIFEGGNTARLGSRTYIPIAKMKKALSPEAANEAHAKKMGFVSAEAYRAHKGYRQARAEVAAEDMDVE